MTANTPISSIAMHHVVHERKRELYTEIHGPPKDPLHLDQTAARRGILFTLREELIVASHPSLMVIGILRLRLPIRTRELARFAKYDKTHEGRSALCHSLRHPLSGFARS